MLTNAPIGDFFFNVPEGYFNPFVWIYVVLLVLVSAVGVWAAELRCQILAAERPESRCHRRSVRTIPDDASGLWCSRLVQGSGTSICHSGSRLHNHAVRPQLEIFAPGFYTFSRFRYLEAVPSPTSRVPSRRLGYHGRRLDRRHLRRNRIVASPRSRPLDFVKWPLGCVAPARPEERRVFRPAGFL